MEDSMKENGKMIQDLAEAMNYIPTEIDMKVILLIINQKEWELIFGVMARYMMANG